MIVVGVDGSPEAKAALEWAADDAFRMHQPLRIVHAVDRWPYQISRFPDVEWYDALTHAGHKVLTEAETIARGRQAGIEVSTGLVEGSPAVVLRDESEQATEVVVGSRGLGGFAGALLGSVSMNVAGHSHSPVVVVRPAKRGPYGRVVVGVDDSAASDAALAYAFEQAALRGSELRAVHALQLPREAYVPGFPYDLDEVRKYQDEIVTEKLAVFTTRYPQLPVTQDLPRAHPVEALVSQEADLLVVGSHGRNALSSALLGSVSRGVLHHARCPVAVIRGR
ncbi:universal stress protein [Nonomuraea sediminis]|uniref:universal stress protein n=1 Tax=Nonomuraea sediminis TaxID=2835864 RepID=UPI001BDC52F5|nr:universal stress protein [Nonomuraea sediminis]